MAKKKLSPYRELLDEYPHYRGIILSYGAKNVDAARVYVECLHMRATDSIERVASKRDLTGNGYLPLEPIDVSRMSSRSREWSGTIKNNHKYSAGKRGMGGTAT